MGAVLATLCGLALWTMPWAGGLENASYDYLFRFGARAVTNKLALILIDNAACQTLGQAGANLPEGPEEQWLRYYGAGGAWESSSYDLALSNSAAYFRDKVVIIGNKPENSDPSFPEQDKFSTPYTRWTGQGVGGVEIMAT